MARKPKCFTVYIPWGPLRVEDEITCDPVTNGGIAVTNGGITVTSCDQPSLNFVTNLGVVVTNQNTPVTQGL